MCDKSLLVWCTREVLGQSFECTKWLLLLLIHYIWTIHSKMLTLEVICSFLHVVEPVIINFDVEFRTKLISWHSGRYIHSLLIFSLIYFLQIYYYKIPNDVELVTIEASSNTQGCTIISIQDNTVCTHCNIIILKRLTINLVTLCHFSVQLMISSRMSKVKESTRQ